MPLPGEASLISAALYAGATHRLGILGVIVAGVAGGTIGYSLGFLIGHWGGYRLIVRYGPYIRFDQAKAKLARYLFRRHGGKIIFFGRFVPILRAYGALLAGTSRMSWRPFLFFNAAGAIVFVVVLIGVVLVRRQERRLEAIAEDAFPGPLEGYPGGPPL